jgi:hypothetical protein
MKAVTVRRYPGFRAKKKKEKKRKKKEKKKIQISVFQFFPLFTLPKQGIKNNSTRYLRKKLRACYRHFTVTTIGRIQQNSSTCLVKISLA